MALVTIEEGSLADSTIVNDNFEYLESLIQEVSENFDTLSASLKASISSLSTTVSDNVTDLDESIEDAIDYVYPIGVPILTLQSTLNDNEIWLEGSTVSRTTYANLYSIYGTTYGSGNGSTTFVLPNFKSRAIWGYSSFGYLSAGLPDIEGGFACDANDLDPTGAFSQSTISSTHNVGGGSNDKGWMDFAASDSNSIYGNSSTVQPPAIKVRVKTRYA